MTMLYVHYNSSIHLHMNKIVLRLRFEVHLVGTAGRKCRPDLRAVSLGPRVPSLPLQELMRSQGLAWLRRAEMSVLTIWGLNWTIW